MIALIDYDLGNLRSVEKALESVGADVQVTSDPQVIASADKVVLPGVGAFGDGMVGLNRYGLIPVLNEIVARGTPLLGICVGMQVLFEIGEEYGEHKGLGYLPGRVKGFESDTLKVPQTGWNQLEIAQPNVLLENLLPNDYAYFNHAFYCDALPEHTLAYTDYTRRYASVVGRGRLYGAQFHPEKSQRVGMTILRNFVERG